MTGVKELLAAPGPKFGTFLVEFDTPGIGYILKHAGCDFVLLDMEHSGFGVERIKSLLRYLEAAGLPAIVGMPSKDPLVISQVLDMGAEAIMSPMVDSLAEVEAALARVKYPPAGARAVSQGVAHDRWALAPLADTMAAANARVAYFAKIETVAGVAAVEAIAARDGVDGLWIGHGDLTASLGVPGQYDHPTFRVASDRVVAAAAANNKPVGRLVATVEEGHALHAAGFSLIGYSGDAWILQAGLGQALAALRQCCQPH